VTDGTIPDYQVSALLMAVVWRGMTEDETTWLTDAMVRSGVRVDLSDIPGAKIDKHSTGGVGDKTSLILAPLAAACGVVVPMMSGRGLGHTGGTLDKLESIAGFRTRLSLDEFRAALCETGCAMIGQTAEIAPADRRLYSLRDVTGTVESIPLICGSILSKKIAEGIDGLVLDVKAGRGAFMKTEADARRLAQGLVRIARASGLRACALLTSMDAPLGHAVGNALEVIESIETLKGKGPRDLEMLSVRLAAVMVTFAGIDPTLEAAEARVRAALGSGAGVERFRQIIACQGGDPRVIDDYTRLPAASRRWIARAPRRGYLQSLDAELVGHASNAVGAGRDRLDDLVDPAVGIIVRAAPGTEVAEGDPVLEIYYQDESRLGDAVTLATRAIVVGDAPVTAPPLILDEVS
jgi:pyrimidine-nucleoside phosphorylase